ncbi:WD repeat-containing protein 60 [Hondaea fermentalgiana]|uniref:WD repeat-containing protein 60 n=1 Tax=Hondaea fermentalgiana TaxID=2315210 RepID=A0A2R5GGU6_9STRA|nr:WD repeat-containing protein 60 [Hondaea fermentalgiana]|eukprot:GBG30107.1 WD repeat-containing protein 60 [Hondaea fermentalgiana]
MLQPNKKSIKKKKKMPINFSVGSSPASYTAPKDADDVSDGPRDETVVNQLAMPKRIVKKKKKSSLAVETINFGADDDFQHGGVRGDETKQDTNRFEKANSDQVHQLDGTGEQGKAVNKDEDIEYDDDFEDYDDDFDDTPPDLLRTSSRKDDRDDLQTLDHGGSEVGIQMSNAGGRGADIRSRVTFRSVRFDHFEMHSLPAWEFYMRSVAAGGNKRQAFAQTNEDNREAYTQTDDIITCTVAIDQDGISQVDEKKSSWRVANVSGKDDEERRSLYRGREDCIGPLERDTDEHDANPRAKHAVDIEIEAAILRKMELMCVATLEENVATSSMKNFHLDRSRATGALSKEVFRDYHRLGTRMPGLAMASRKVVSITASPSLHKVFLSVHGQCSLEDVLEETKSGNKIEARRIAKSSILCLWDLRLSASSPQFSMACVGAATCGLLSPGSAVVVLAGMEDGTLFAWDLRGLEPSDLQASAKQSFGRLLPPSYSTAGETALARTHLAPICNISLVSSAPTSVSQLGFQVASLDLDGRIHIWSILHKSTLLAWDLDDKSEHETVSDPDKPQFTSDVEGTNQGQNADLGALCGKLRLHHMAMIDTLGHGVAPDRLVIGRATVAAFQPENADRIVLGSSDGRIRHVSRSGLRFVPREFSSSSSPSFSSPYSDTLAESQWSF